MLRGRSRGSDVLRPRLGRGQPRPSRTAWGRAGRSDEQRAAAQRRHSTIAGVPRSRVRSTLRGLASRSEPHSVAQREERSRPAGGNIIHLLCLARGRRGACEPCALPFVVVSGRTKMEGQPQAP